MRSDNLNARLDQVVPVADALGIALANQEEDRRQVGTVVVGQLVGTGLPIFGQQALLGDRIYVVSQGPGDYRGFRTIDDAAGLLARSAVRRMDGYVSPVVSFQCLAKATSYSLYNSRVGS